MTPPLIRLENVDVVLKGATILRGINWRLRPGEHWAILGGNGSGKSTLLKLIRAELAPAPGRGHRVYAFDGDEQATAVGIKEKIALVSPELQGRYLHQEWMLTGWQVIQSGFHGGDYVYQKPPARQLALARSIVRKLALEKLVRRNVQELSTGELRKILVARALAGAPRVLVCDELCDGLDATARAGLLRLLEQVARNGTQLLLTTHRAEEIIPSVTHRLVLNEGRIVEQVRLNQNSRRTPQNFGLRQRSAVFDLIDSCGKSGAAPPQSRTLARRLMRSAVEARPLIRIERANVFLGAKRVLRNIHLEIRAGQHWAILGGNGAGKSTLLKLMLGDLHPALGGRVRRFEFTPRNMIWDWKRRMGFVSPELQSNYREAMTGAEAIASGFFSSVGLMQRASRDQMRKVAALVAALGLRELAARNILHMSYGEFRRILLARALVQEPEVLICDEPFDGLDASARADFARALEGAARRGANLVMVTHHPADLPRCITHVGRLDAGRLIFQGAIEDYLSRNSDNA